LKVDLSNSLHVHYIQNSSLPLQSDCYQLNAIYPVAHDLHEKNNRPTINMRVRASSASAVVVSLLVNDVFAAIHGRHEMIHRKRTEMDVTVTDDVVETKTEVIYVTVEWPGGETLGVEYPSDMPTPVASTTSPVSGNSFLHCLVCWFVCYGYLSPSRSGPGEETSTPPSLLYQLQWPRLS